MVRNNILEKKAMQEISPASASRNSLLKFVKCVAAEQKYRITTTTTTTRAAILLSFTNTS